MSILKEDYLSLRELQEEPTEYQEGFGWKAAIGGLFVGFLMVPGNMFLQLMVGASLGAAADWVTIIIFIEIAKRCRTKLTKQEIFILYMLAGGVLGGATGGYFHQFIWMQYFVRSEAAVNFGIGERIPIWVAAPPESEAYKIRSLLHRDWWPHISMIGIGIIWGRLTLYSLGYTFFRLTSDIERLPFPLAPIAAQGVTALAESEKETWRWKCFSIGATIGIVFGALYIGVPTLTAGIVGQQLQIIKVPFYDFTRNIETLLPAVPIKLPTNIGQIFTGFVLPFWMIIGSAIAGVIGQLILNPILYRCGMLTTWKQGMGFIETSIANSLDFWMSWGIGVALAVALIGFYEVAKALIKARSQKREHDRIYEPPKGRGDIPIPLSILFYVATTSWTIILSHMLVPKFPIWIMFIFGFFYTPLMSYISARMVGLTGHGVGFPYVDDAAFILSGYKGIDIWMAPMPIGNHGGQAAFFRQTELTGTTFTSLFKMQLYIIPLAFFCSLFFWSFIWRMGKIPSHLYPYAAIYWPMNAFQRAFWLTATTTGNEFFLSAIKFPVIGAGLTFGLVGYPIMRLLGLPTLLLYGMIRGMATDPMDCIPEVLAACTGRWYFTKRFGLKNWSQYTPILAAGFGCGMGLIGMVCVAVSLVSKAISALPF
ncbi:MAG: peptide transporter [Planctomycetota bacterium]